MSSEVCSVCEQKPQAIIKEAITLETCRALLEAWQHKCALLVPFSYEMLTKMLISSADDERGQKSYVVVYGWWSNFVFTFLFKKIPNCKGNSLLSVNITGADSCWIWKLLTVDCTTMPKYCIFFFLLRHWASVGKFWLFSSVWWRWVGVYLAV